MNVMMKFLERSVSVAPVGVAAIHFPRRFETCWLLFGPVWFLTLTQAVADDIETAPGSDRNDFLQCAQTEADAERLSCFDQYMRLARPDIRESLGPAAADLTQCANLVQKSVRTACFDAAANEVRNSSNGIQLNDEVTAEPIETGTAGEPGIADPGTELGQEQLETVAQKTAKAKGERITATVIDLNRNAFGLYSFHLDNGQVWQQTEIDRFVPPDNDFLVEIRRGTFSGYRLRIDNQNQILRVKRLQ